jgi:serine/threonine protein kinase
MRPSPGNVDETIGATQALGDFRIIREIGRGGMGIVYEAEQISLRRRVALKTLPFAAALGDHQLQRFQNEARAVALLKNPNIVSVYSVGFDRGVHYYAMELIAGRSLAEVIEQLRRADGKSQNGQSVIRSVGSAVDTKPIAALSTLGPQTYPGRFRSISHLGLQAAEAVISSRRTFWWMLRKNCGLLILG